MTFVYHNWQLPNCCNFISENLWKIAYLTMRYRPK